MPDILIICKTLFYTIIVIIRHDQGFKAILILHDTLFNICYTVFVDHRMIAYVAEITCFRLVI